VSASARSDRPGPAEAAWFRGRRVTVAGLGRFGGGVGVTRWLAGLGAEVTVSDVASPGDLADSLRALEDLDLTLHLGGHEEADFLEADLLVVNPAIPRDAPLVAAADAAGVPRTTEINLFLERCGARVVGVTGTVGKSTTTAMAGRIVGARHTTHVGGNIGKSLLASLDEIRPDHVVVLELSSFQLTDTPRVGFAPEVALVTNLRANHVKWHGSVESYSDAKKNIFRYQSPGDVLILNAGEAATVAWADEAPGRVMWFDPSGKPFALRVPGEHNQANAQAARAIGEALGVDRQEADEALRGFRGLPHRLQFVCERDGVRYYNDSKCTTPEGAVVALDAFAPRTVVLLAGGSDKGVGFAPLGAAAAERAKAVIVFGETREKILHAVAESRPERAPALERAADLPAALERARRHAERGDSIVLSPACASYDQFANYEQRGDLFVRLATE